ncbi:bifunctional 2-polyprenyl-6-hydroxyphenol methylase/3-demethylubiquinol 3-O-methyltransferase UbiG [Nocardiopsis sp. HUAS JQ3]|uniref:class I SAM-dependent methyltransferase n=1 Tax=Nocardiopsis sp. HUAS JQ3 TaxID=3061629 RepID=UPI0023A9DD26|nr:class I SAM-dependent methyltransferase [Nocardiopsis sp. HUAS JQ3]WDZ93529.1 class I SAM-dependent methyltransferase [Nocardiopsis sp. HUAS JQ3]
MNLFSDLLKEFGAPGERLADLGCGTGNSSVELHKNGYRVTGVDLSPAMVSVAEGKEEMRGIDFLVGGLADLPLPSGRFDAVVSAGEAFHYLSGDEELDAAFAEAARVLVPAGLLVVEVNTELSFRVLSQAPNIRRSDDGFIAFSPLAPTGFVPGGSIDLEADSFARVRGGELWERSITRHRLRHLTHERILEGIASAGLEFVCVRGFHAGALEEGLDNGKHPKALYVARRTDSAD